MQIRLYIDEDASRSVLVQALRSANVDILTTLEASNLSLSDAEQLIYATHSERVIYTFNVRDYYRIHTTYMEQERQHTGIIVAERQSYSIGEQLRGLQKIIASYSAAKMRNNLLFLGQYIRATESY